MNPWNIIIGIVIAAAIGTAVFFLIRNKKKGNSCCGNCSKCNGCK